MADVATIWLDWRHAGHCRHMGNSYEISRNCSYAELCHAKVPTRVMMIHYYVINVVSHCSDIIMASQITVVSTVCSAACSGTDQRKHQSSAWLAFLRGIHRSPMDSPHKGPVTRKIFPFDDVIMKQTRMPMIQQPSDEYIRSRHRHMHHSSLWPLARHNVMSPLLWRHNGRDGVSNHQPADFFLNHLFRRRWKNTSKLRVTGPCAGNSPVTGEFPAQMASHAEMFSFYDVIMPLWLIIHCIYRLEYTTH